MYGTHTNALCQVMPLELWQVLHVPEVMVVEAVLLTACKSERKRDRERDRHR